MLRFLRLQNEPFMRNVGGQKFKLIGTDARFSNNCINPINN